MACLWTPRVSHCHVWWLDRPFWWWITTKLWELIRFPVVWQLSAAEDIKRYDLFLVLFGDILVDIPNCYAGTRHSNRGNIFRGEETYETPRLAATLQLLHYFQETEEQTDRQTSPLHKAFFKFRNFFGKAASNVGPYGLFWQPAVVRHYHRYYMYVY